MWGYCAEFTWKTREVSGMKGGQADNGVQQDKDDDKNDDDTNF